MACTNDCGSHGAYCMRPGCPGLCPSLSRWHDDGKITQCVLEDEHAGKHSDGLARWDTAHEYGRAD